ncbi:MAG: hypothetical protein ACFHU9_07475 [Fluviicola sp.]
MSSTSTETLSSTHSFSDSIHLYLQTALLGVLSTFIAFVLYRWKKASIVLPWIRTGVTFILAFFLLKYGIEKWTRLQFPLPPPNILHAEVGSLDKDILFWSLMGSSKAYAGFMGFVEIAAGILLFFRKTRFLGGYLALGVFVNVLAINVGFNISVKLLSLALVLASFYLIEPTLRPVFRLLSNRPVKPLPDHNVDMKPLLHRGLKGFVVTLILLECIWPTIDRPQSQFNPKTINQQSLIILETEQCPEGIPQQEYKRIHFHPHGYLITETFEGTFHSFPIHIPEGSNQFKLPNGQRVKAIKNGQEWLFVDGNQLLWRCKRIRNEDLPLLQDEFHWTVEDMIPK